MACGVVFPDIAFTSSSQEIIPEIVFDTRTGDITDYLNAVFDYWMKRRHKEPSKLSKNLANNIHSQLSDIVNLKVINIHALFGEYVPVDVSKLSKDPQTYYVSGTQ